MDDAPQSKRLESELHAMRTLFAKAEEDEKVADMIRISKVISDFEKNIRKMKIEEGELLPQKRVLAFVDDLTLAGLEAIQKHVKDKDLRDTLVDDMLQNLDRDWKQCLQTSDTS